MMTVKVVARTLYNNNKGEKVKRGYNISSVFDLKDNNNNNNNKQTRETGLLNESLSV